MRLSEATNQTLPCDHRPQKASQDHGCRAALGSQSTRSSMSLNMARYRDFIALCCQYLSAFLKFCDLTHPQCLVLNGSV